MKCHNNLIFIIIILIISQIHSHSYINPTIIILSNNNYFIIHLDGIDICDREFNKKKEVMNFPEGEKIIADNLSKVSLTELDGKYIISIIINNLYAFDEEGNLLTTKKINQINPSFYTLIPWIERNNYYIFYGYIDDNKKFQFYSKYFNANDRYFQDSGALNINDLEDKKPIKKSGLSCHIMEEKQKGQLIACFYIYINDDDDEIFKVEFYSLIRDGGAINRIKDISPSEINIPNVNFFKVDINSEKNKALICFILLKGLNTCLSYDINTKSFSSNYICNNNLCKKRLYSLKVYYFPENEEFIFSCSGNNGNVSLCIFNNNFEYESLMFNLDECFNIEGYSNIYKDGKYYIISENSCSGIPKYIQNNKETTKIEEEKEEEEQEKEEENKEEEKEREEDVEEINNYNCKINKCKTCDKKSEENNLCIKCNNNNGFYPLNISSLFEYENYNNKYVDCFNEKTKPQIYYFNLTEYIDFKSIY